jgi:hypothetical protein
MRMPRQFELANARGGSGIGSPESTLRRLQVTRQYKPITVRASANTFRSRAAAWW